MGKRIEHRIGVSAPPEAIWSVMADIDNWSAWNPVYTQAAGKVAIGETLRFQLALAGRKPMALTGKVIDWVPNEQLIWRMPLFGGALRVTRYIEIEQLSGAGCILANGEIQEGLAAGVVPQGIRRAIRDGMQAMNEAAKARIEALVCSGARSGVAA